MSSSNSHVKCGKLNCLQCLYSLLEIVSDEEMEDTSQADNRVEEIVSSEDEELEAKSDKPKQQQTIPDGYYSCDNCVDSPHSAPNSP